MGCTPPRRERGRLGHFPTVLFFPSVFPDASGELLVPPADLYDYSPTATTVAQPSESVHPRNHHYLGLDLVPRAEWIFESESDRLGWGSFTTLFPPVSSLPSPSLRRLGPVEPPTSPTTLSLPLRPFLLARVRDSKSPGEDCLTYKERVTGDKSSVIESPNYWLVAFRKA